MLPGLQLSLPSEACWEYACRAGTTTATYAGNLPKLTSQGPFLTAGQVQQGRVLDPIAWWKGNSDDTTHPVAAKAPNTWGLHDMLGNVWEWCADRWHDNYEGAPDDGSAWTNYGARADYVIRGGSWERRVRAAMRSHNHRTYCSDGLGFRCARVQAG